MSQPELQPKSPAPSEVRSLGDRTRVEQTDRFNYIKFAKMPEVRALNEGLIVRAMDLLPEEFTEGDVATGTGLTPELVAKRCHETGRRARIIGIDPDRFALEYARQTNKDSSLVQFEFIQGFGQNLDTLLDGKIPSGIDWISMHDSIHEIPDTETKIAIIQSVAKILNPNGIFTVNSAFTTIAMEGSRMEYGKWRSEAFSYLGEQRDKSVKDIEVLTPQQYKEMVTNAGLTIIHDTPQPVILSLEALEAISLYPEFIIGSFRNMQNTDEYSLEQKSEALIAALKIRNIQTLKRVLYEIVAQKLPLPNAA